MTGFVLDCSVAVAWLFDDEATVETDALLDRLKDDEAYVPALWRLELGNVLVQAERRGRISAAQAAAHVDRVEHLPIVTDDDTERRAFSEILLLARAHSLTTYDAAYLELAMRRDVELATLDSALVHAARSVDVATLPG